MTNHIGKAVRNNPLKSIILGILAVLFVIALNGATQAERSVTPSETSDQ